MYAISFISGAAIATLLYNQYQKRVNKPIARIIDYAVIEEKLTNIFELRRTLSNTIEHIESETEELFTQLEDIKDMEYIEKLEDKETKNEEKQQQSTSQPTI